MRYSGYSLGLINIENVKNKVNKTNLTNKKRIIENIKASIIHSPEKIDYHEYLKERLQYDLSGRCTNAFTTLTELYALEMSYNSIRSNPGNMVPGTDKETLDGISNE